MKVHIVGAGPAGSIAAISALKNGSEVVMSEDHSVCGLPENCSGLFSLDGLNSLKTFIDYKQFVINPIYGANIYLADQKISIRKKTPVGFVCDRSQMDFSLAKTAESLGAKINFQERIKDKFHSDNIIGADGPLSTVASHFGFPKIKKYAATLQARIPYKSTEPIVEVHISEKFPGFFAWIIPHNEEFAEIGLGVELPNQVHTAWNYLLKMKKIDGYGIKPKGAIIPIVTRQKTGLRVGKKNICLVGDAAGQVKSTTGGGVIFGGNCAAIAGKHFSNPSRYELEWKLRFGIDLKVHNIIHNHLASLSEKNLSNAGKKLQNLKLGEFLSKNGHMDRPTKMLNLNLLAHTLSNFSALF